MYVSIYVTNSLVPGSFASALFWQENAEVSISFVIFTTVQRLNTNFILILRFSTSKMVKIADFIHFDVMCTLKPLLQFLNVRAVKL